MKGKKLKNTAVKKEKLFLILFCTFLGFVCISINSMFSFLYKIVENNDTNCFVTTARCMIHGDVLYRDVYEHKGPILYFLYAIGLMIDSQSFIGIFVVETLLFSLYIFFMYKITELFVEKKVFRYILITCAAWISCCDRGFDGGGQCEELTLPFLCITMYLVLKYFKQEYPNRIKASSVITIGACFAVVLWMKYTLTGLYLGLVILIMIYQIKDKKIRNLWLYIAEFLLGVCIGSLPVIIYFSINGGFDSLFDVYFYKLIFEYSKGNMERLHFADYFFQETFIKKHLLNASCYFLVLVYCVGRRDTRLNINIRIVIATMILFQIMGISTSYYFYYLSQAFCLFSILGVLIVYFWIYDTKGKLLECRDGIIRLVANVMTKDYMDMGGYVIFFIAIVLLIAGNPVWIFDEVVLGIVIARMLIRAENVIKDKIKHWVFLKYLFVLILFFVSYELIVISVIIAYLLLVIYDYYRFKTNICVFIKKACEYVTRNVSKAVIKVLEGVAVALIIIVVTLNTSRYSKFMLEDLNNYPEYQIAQYINQGTIENPKIIYWNCFDQGIYWMTNTYPPYKYFCFYNLKSDYIPNLFKTGMDSGEIDYVVSTEKISDDNFELVYYGERTYREFKDRPYYLYERKDGGK